MGSLVDIKVYMAGYESIPMHPRTALIVNASITVSSPALQPRSRTLAASLLDHLYHSVFNETLEGTGFPLPDEISARAIKQSIRHVCWHPLTNRQRHKI